MGDAIRPVRLPDGTEVWVRASNLPRLGGQDDYDDLYEDVGLWENVVTRVEGLKETVEGVARSVRTATAAVAPDETAVTFGIEVSAKPGKAVAVLADGEAKANLSITLTWHHADRRAARRAAADTDAGPAPVPGPAPGDGAEEGDSRAGA
ncbi:CU044_2847 family protein [Streptomyces xanthii]|uniref:CU044_2847 family protein n=1 Tax=Streptomyces xanthii TaxID=2768069 RepID=UPI001CB7936D|nr:CU044_2847 family protein [Streptomyces xanthii]